MTLTEARDLARLFANASTVYVSMTDLDKYIAMAEVELAIDLTERAPQSVLTMDDYTWPANTWSVTLDTTVLAHLGASRSVYKIAAIVRWDSASHSTSGIRRLISPCATIAESAGESESRETGGEEASNDRWEFLQQMLHLYPTQTCEQYLSILYVRVPVAQTTPASNLLVDFGAEIQSFAYLVPLRAAVRLRRGQVDAWVLKELEAWEARLRAYLSPNMQMQEQATQTFSRYFCHDAVGGGGVG